MTLFKLIILSTILHGIFASLEVANDDSLVELIKNEKYVVVLFS